MRERERRIKRKRRERVFHGGLISNAFYQVRVSDAEKMKGFISTGALSKNVVSFQLI